MFTQDDVVFTYTRKNEIAGGVQVTLLERFPNDCGGPMDIDDPDSTITLAFPGED